MSGRLTKLENAIAKQRTVKFPYYSIARNVESERTVNPYALLHDRESWYVIGLDHDAKDIRTFRVSRVRGDIRFATRRERDFRPPTDFDPSEFRGRQDWQFGEIVGEAEIELDPNTAWWAERMIERGAVEHDVLTTPYAGLDALAGWVLRQEGRARPLAPKALVDEVDRGLRHVVEVHTGEPSKPPRAAVAKAPEELPERPAGPVTAERFGVLQALLAYLLDSAERRPPERFPPKSSSSASASPPTSSRITSSS